MNDPEKALKDDLQGNRKGFTFYRSFYDSVKDLDQEKQFMFYKAIIEYALDNIDPDLSDKYVKSIFTLIKPNIDASIKKYDQRYKISQERSKKAKENKRNELETKTERTLNELVSNDANKNKNKNKNKIKTKTNIKELIYKDLPLDLRNAMEDFELMRSQIKKPLTDRARKTILQKLQEYSNGRIEIQIEILNRSIENCWSSVYPLNDQGKYKSNNKGLSTEAILELGGMMND